MKDNPARIRYAGDDLFVATTPTGHAQVLDTNGGRSSAASPLELLLVALGGCTAVDVVSILNKSRAQITRYDIEVSGRRRDEHPRSFEQIEVHHILHGRNITERAVERAIKLSEEKYCSVAATLRPAAAIISRYTILPDSESGAANQDAVVEEEAPAV